MSEINAIGLMSGSSLDGLDVAYCTFTKKENKWLYKIVSATTFPFPEHLQEKLSSVTNISGLDLMVLNKALGEFSANCIAKFLKDNDLKQAELIASHGHTVFHQPQKGFTTQIGCGATINALTKIKTICDFRSSDVALGGQGAPLVPIGDALLFNGYDACLNLGGIANVSFDKNGQRLAYDISFANMPLNYICDSYFACAYDENGALGKQGKPILSLLDDLKQLDFYKKTKPKSLGREDFEHDVLPLLKAYANKKDVLATFYAHLSDVLARELDAFANVLVTGGGALNPYFMDLLRQKTSAKLDIPERKVIEYKEALIFAFLGVLNLVNETNVLKTVTGSRSNSTSGAVYDAFR